MPKESKSTILQKLNPKNLDFIGAEFQLNFTKNGRYQTKVGGLISTLVTIVLSLVVYSSIRELLSTDSPIATVSQVYTRKAPKFDLLKQKLFIHFGFLNGGAALNVKTQLHEINRFVTIKGFVAHQKPVGAQGLRPREYSFELKYKPCYLVNDQTVIEDIQWHDETKILMDNYGLCPEMEDAEGKYFVKNKFQDSPNFTIMLFIYPCSLPNAADCASIDEFKGSQLIHTNTRKGFDASNYKQPFYTNVEFDGYEQIDPRISGYLYYKVRDNEVWDDTQDFFNKKLRAKTADYYADYRDKRMRDASQLHCDAGVLNTPQQQDCQPYFQILMTSSGEKRVIVRIYSKFFNTLGEIGGTAEILIIFCCLLYFKYNSFYLKKYIKNEVFNYKSLNEDRFLNWSNKINRIFQKKQPQSLYSLNSINGVSQGNPKLMTRKSTFGLLKRKKKEIICHRKKVNNLLNEQIEENFNGISLFKSLNELKILRKLFFKPRHRKLLPIILINMKEREKAAEPAENYAKKKIPNQSTTSEKLSPEEEISVQEAIDRLSCESSQSQPKSSFERAMDEFVLEHLQGGKSCEEVRQMKPPPPPQQTLFKFLGREEKGPDFKEFSEIGSLGILNEERHPVKVSRESFRPNNNPKLLKKQVSQVRQKRGIFRKKRRTKTHAFKPIGIGGERGGSMHSVTKFTRVGSLRFSNQLRSGNRQST